MRIAAALVIAYLLGSVLPADLLARARGVDIREVGTRNPGATNALQQLGPLPGLLTGVYDASVGLAAMYFAHRLGLAPSWVYVAGLTAVVGHVFPVFFGLRGGQGMAATTGMLAYGIAVALTRGWLTPIGVAALAVLGLAVFWLTRSASDVGVVTPPLLVLELLAARPDLAFALFMLVLTVWIWAVQLSIVRRGHLFRLAEPVRERLARLHPLSR